MRGTVRCTVRWQSSSDYGRVMAAQTVDLTRDLLARQGVPMAGLSDLIPIHRTRLYYVLTR